MFVIIIKDKTIKMGLKKTQSEKYSMKKKIHIFLLDDILMSREIRSTSFALIASWLDRGQGS